MPITDVFKKQLAKNIGYIIKFAEIAEQKMLLQLKNAENAEAKI